MSGRQKVLGPEISRRRLGGLLFSGLSTALLLPACDRPKGARVRLRQEWFPYAGYAGEVMAVKKFASALGLTLSVIAGGETTDSIKTVLSGEDDMGVASGDLVISAIAGGAPLVVIGVINDISPTCFVVREDSNIRTIQDFISKRVGILQGTNTQRIYETMMKRNGIDRAKITEVDVPFDVRTFVLGQYDVRPAFIYDEPVTFSRANIPIRIIEPKNYAVNFVGTVYFTRRDVVTNRRSELITVLRALVQGWRAIASREGQEEAIKYLKDMFPEVDSSREADSLARGAQFFLGPAGMNRPLDVTLSHWTDTIRGLEELGTIKTGVVKIENVWFPDMLSEAYAQLVPSK